MTAIQEYERTLSEYLLSGLMQTPDVFVWGLADPARSAERIPTVAFTRQSETPRAVCERLAPAQICCVERKLLRSRGHATSKP